MVTRGPNFRRIKPNTGENKVIQNKRILVDAGVFKSSEDKLFIATITK